MLEPEPPQPERSSNTGAPNDPQRTRLHLHEASENTFFHEDSMFCPLPYDAADSHRLVNLFALLSKF